MGTMDSRQLSPWKSSSEEMSIPKRAALRMAGRMKEQTIRHQLFHLLFVTTQLGTVSIPTVWMKRLKIRLESGVS